MEQTSNSRIFLNPVIQINETSKNLAKLLEQNNITVKDLQKKLGFKNPQCIYAWLKGKSLPHPIHLISISKILDVEIKDILVWDCCK